jgi:hypothetical protein
MSLKRNVTVPTGRLAIGSIVYKKLKKEGKPLIAEACDPASIRCAYRTFLGGSTRK